MISRCGFRIVNRLAMSNCRCRNYAKRFQPYGQPRLACQTSISHVTKVTIMPREAEPSINELEFVLEALQQEIRLDGRALDTYRDVNITFGDDYGVADVRLGKTRYHSIIS